MRRAVITDDSKMARTIIVRCLEIVGGGGWECVEASDGEAALKLLRAGDLLITDLNMPRMNGLDLVRRVRASPKLADVVVLVVSSGADAEISRSLEQLGAHVLPKPITPPQVASALRSLDLREEESS